LPRPRRPKESRRESKEIRCMLTQVLLQAAWLSSLSCRSPRLPGENHSHKLSSHQASWRNWQTRWIQNPVPVRAYRFDSDRGQCMKTFLLCCVCLLMFGCATHRAANVNFDTYGGYFVSNKFEPQAA